MKPPQLPVAILLLAMCGCQAKSPAAVTRYEFLEQLRQHATRDDSRVNPKAMLRSELIEIAREPKSREAVDETAERWRYEFLDGPLELYVLVEPGSDWRQANPTVFVDFKRLPKD